MYVCIYIYIYIYIYMVFGRERHVPTAQQDVARVQHGDGVGEVVVRVGVVAARDGGQEVEEATGGDVEEGEETGVLKDSGGKLD